MNRSLARLGTVTLAALAATLVLAAPALAHTEITADKPQAGATDVTLTVTAQAERGAGIVSVRIVLPEGIAPSQVSLVSGPARWTLSTTSDGFTVAGAALASKTDAQFAVKVAQLPAHAQSLAFKTLVTYANGGVDRWIEIPTPNNPKPDNPAPVVSLQPVSAAPTPSEAVVPSPSSAPTGASPQAQAPKKAGNTGWLIGGLALLVAAALAGLLFARRRRGGSTPGGPTAGGAAPDDAATTDAATTDGGPAQA